MSTGIQSDLRAVALILAALALAACSKYIKRDEFDTTIAELQRTDQSLQQQIDALAGDLRHRLDDHEARITALQGRIRVDAVALFDFDQATMRERDKPVLDEFATVIREHHPNVLITVEGFADPAGSAAYNKRLAQRRAEAVRDHLVRAGGLNPERVRAVGYGEDANRQVVPGAWGPEGEANRRAVLVIDYTDAAGALAQG